jgi:hypothetical protein
MADRLSALHDISNDFFQSYNTYQVPTLRIPSQRSYFPSVETKQDAIHLNNFLASMEDQLFQPQFTVDCIPQYPSKTLYPTLDVDYNQPADLTPSTQLYPPLFDQAAAPSNSTYMGMGSRMPYDQTKLVSTGVLQKAPPRAESEELVDHMEKMVVDSEPKEKETKPEKEVEEEKTEENDKDVKAKHLALIKKLQKLVQELILEREKEEARTEVKEESLEEKPVSIAAH